MVTYGVSYPVDLAITQITSERDYETANIRIYNISTTQKTYTNFIAIFLYLKKL